MSNRLFPDFILSPYGATEMAKEPTPTTAPQDIEANQIERYRLYAAACARVKAAYAEVQKLALVTAAAQQNEAKARQEHAMWMADKAKALAAIEAAHA